MTLLRKALFLVFLAFVPIFAILVALFFVYGMHQTGDHRLDFLYPYARPVVEKTGEILGRGLDLISRKAFRFAVNHREEINETSRRILTGVARIICGPPDNGMTPEEKHILREIETRYRDSLAVSACLCRDARRVRDGRKPNGLVGVFRYEIDHPTAAPMAELGRVRARFVGFALQCKEDGKWLLIVTVAGGMF